MVMEVVRVLKSTPAMAEPELVATPVWWYFTIEIKNDSNCFKLAIEPISGYVLIFEKYLIFIV